MSSYNDFRNRLDKLTGNEKRLKILLENISDTYDDFVKGELYTAVEYGYVDKMIEYIENSSPELTTSDDVTEKGDEYRNLTEAQQLLTKTENFKVGILDMSQNSEQKLKKLLIDVKDSYDDFVETILLLSKRNNLVEQMIEYIENTSDVTTSDVDDKIDNLRGS